MPASTVTVRSPGSYRVIRLSARVLNHEGEVGGGAGPIRSACRRRARPPADGASSTRPARRARPPVWPARRHIAAGCRRSRPTSPAGRKPPGTRLCELALGVGRHRHQNRSASRPLPPGAAGTGPAPHRRDAVSEAPCRDCRGRAGRTPPRTSRMTSRSVGAEHLRHRVALVAPTPCSPVIDPPASTQYQRISPADVSGAIGLAGHAPVVADERMEIAVAGMEHVADAQAGSDAEIANPPKHLGQASSAAPRRPGRSSSAPRGPWPRTPPCGPSRFARDVARSRRLRRRSPQAAGRFEHDRRQFADLRRRSVELDDENRVRVGKPACTAASAARMASASIISMAAGTMPAPMIADTAAPPASMLSNAARNVCTVSGRRRIRTTAFVAMPSVPSEPTIEPDEIRPGRVHHRAAHGDHLAVGQHELERQDVVRRETVLQAMRAA